MDLLNQWQDGLFNSPVFRFPKLVVASGERIAHLGPRFDFARIRLRFEPAETFTVSLEGAPTDQDGMEFAQGALFGVLDVLMTFAKCPVLNVCVTIEQMEIDEIDSNAGAFRLAGRDAAYKALENSGLHQWNNSE
jgi:hypothetical protein